MANSRQAKKRAKQAEKRRQHNTSRRTKMRTCIKKVRAAIELKDSSGAQAAFKAMCSILDKFSVKGLIHKNRAARYKSRLNAQIKALVTQQA